MGHVNSNDIDDLFKQASDKYPLRTDSSDWSKVAADLEKDPSLILPPLNNEDNRRRRRRFFWLFLLLPLAGIGYYTWHTTHGNTIAQQRFNTIQERNSAGTVQGTAGNDMPNQNGNTTGEENMARGGNTTRERNTTKDRSTVYDGNAIHDENATRKGNNEQNGNTVQDERAARNGHDAQQSNTVRDENAAREVNGQSDHDVARNNRPIRNNSFARNNAREQRNDQGQNISLVQDNDKNGAANLNVTKGSVTSPGAKKETQKNDRGNNQGRVHAFDATAANLSVQRAPMPPGYAVNIPVKGRENPVSSGAGAKKDDPAKKKKKPSFFYAGLFAAPDLSTIKFQSVKGVGTTFGVMLGYQFNTHWAIETGLYDDRKKYYTDGEYFNKSKIPNWNNINLLNVDGVCNMWEIPVNVRYNLSTGDKMKWFATAGFSTYLMTHERYKYLYTYGSGTTPYSRDWSAANTSKYPFSIFNLSVGYEQRLGKIGNLRLEPYIRVPLAGIGTGSLSIMSTGLNIGLTRKLW